MTRLTTVTDPEAAAERAAQQIALIIKDALARREVAHISLAGGSTPRRTYEILAAMVPDWSGVELWYGDERCVEPEDEQSNHQLVARSLLSGIAGVLPIEHRIRGELGAEEAARKYAEQLAARVPSDGEADLPVLDLALLGLGEDGHTASLFPGHPEVQDESGAICLPVHNAPKPPPERVTLSLHMLQAARHCLLLATGVGKADAVAAVLAGPDPRVPSSLLASGRLYIVTDDSAAPSLETP